MPANPEFSQLPGPKRPIELLRPDVGAGTGGNLLDTPDFDSSEGFEIPFIIELNQNTLHFLQDGIRSHLAVGVGAGGDIRRMQELWKYHTQHRVIGVDIEHSELVAARRRFPDPTGEIYLFVQGAAENLPVADASIDALTFLNTMHLYEDLPAFFREAKRVLKPGGRGVGNSAYVLDFQFPDPNKDAREWGNPIVLSRLDLRKQRAREMEESGASDIPERIEKPQTPAKYTKAEIESFAQQAGLSVKTRVDIANVSRAEAVPLFLTKEFANGVLPGVPLHKARPVLQKAVNTTFDDKEGAPLRRFWTTVEIENPT